jgi:hypothetical protein
MSFLGLDGLPSLVAIRCQQLKSQECQGHSLADLRASLAARPGAEARCSGLIAALEVNQSASVARRSRITIHMANIAAGDDHADTPPSMVRPSLPREPPATERGLRTRAALVAAARKVFERLGYLDARLIDITRAQTARLALADLWLEVSSAGATARYAADTCARGDADTPIAAAVAQAYCSTVAVHAAEECIQLHGGIGMTWEYPAHLYLKRAKSDQLALGTAYRHRARLAELIDLPTSP